MENKKLPEETGLTFYSRVSASISHELKNSLAVINESAGFLEDITLMVQKGRPLDPNQIGALAATILKQVQRSNGIVKNMNRLAHSLDEKHSSLDLIALLELMSSLSERTAVNRGVNISSALPESPISVTTCPFYLETLIWLLLELSMDTCGNGRTVVMNAAATGAGARIDFSGLEELTASATDGFFSGGLKPLLTALNADLEIIESEGRLVLSLTDTISAGLDE